MKTLNQLIEDFLDCLKIEKNKTPQTIKNYKFYLNRFINFAELKKLDEITLEKVDEFRHYLNHLKNKKGEQMQKNTQNYHLIALRAFLKYLAERQIKTLAFEEIELERTSWRQINFLESHDLKKLLDVPEQYKNPTIIQKRDKAILELLFSTGLRVSEISNLKRDQIDLTTNEFVINGKERLRKASLSERLKYYLKEYFALRSDDLPALFIRHDRARKEILRKDDAKKYKLTPRSIQRIVQKYAHLAGITKKVTPYIMRHSYAASLLSRGIDIHSLQKMLGHASIFTTRIYANITNQKEKAKSKK